MPLMIKGFLYYNEQMNAVNQVLSFLLKLSSCFSGCVA